jgi:signal transduction histidine kinase
VLSAAGLVACILVLHAFDWSSVVAVVFLFLVALEGDRRRSIVVGIAAAAILIGVLIALIPVLDGGDAVSNAGTRMLAALCALVLGDLVRSRRALRVAAAEKTERELDELRRRAEGQAVAERLRIARELHDTLAHALVAINVRSGVTAHLGVSPEAAEALTEIKNVSAQALTDLRGTLDVLRDPDTPAARNPALGLSAVPQLLARANAAGLRTVADLSLDGAAVPSVIDQTGFRIVQESITNVMRHAHASHAQVRIATTPESLVIEVTDDGRGDNAHANGNGNGNGREHREGPGHGLQGMAERATAVGGTITAGPRPGRGWRVRAALPLTVRAPSR